MTTVVEAPPMLAFEVVVADVQELSPSFRRITFAGASLSRFSRGPVNQLGQRSNLDLRVKLMVPSNGHPLPSFADLSAGWYQQWLAMDAVSRGYMRTYTVRSTNVDGADPRIDIDFVAHVDESGHGGPASSWALSAAVGDRLTILGPNERSEAYGGIEWQPSSIELGETTSYVDELHPHARRVLLVGDETATPAISSILESLPAGYSGHAYLEVPSKADFLPLTTASGVEITWLARDGRPHGEALSQAVRGGRGLLSAAGMHHRGEEPEDVDIDKVILWDTPDREPQDGLAPAAAPRADAQDHPGFYAWIAGEAGTVKELRRYLVRDLGVDRKRVAFMGYWRRGKAEGS